jgi:hypothetical protein
MQIEKAGSRRPFLRQHAANLLISVTAAGKAKIIFAA